MNSSRRLTSTTQDFEIEKDVQYSQQTRDGQCNLQIAALLANVLEALIEYAVSMKRQPAILRLFEMLHQVRGTAASKEKKPEKGAASDENVLLYLRTIRPKTSF